MISPWSQSDKLYATFERTTVLLTSSLESQSENLDIFGFWHFQFFIHLVFDLKSSDYDSDLIQQSRLAPAFLRSWAEYELTKLNETVKSWQSRQVHWKMLSTACASRTLQREIISVFLFQHFWSTSLFRMITSTEILVLSVQVCSDTKWCLVISTELRQSMSK